MNATRHRTGHQPRHLAATGRGHRRGRDAARNLLHALGADITDESLADTPGRVARMYAEMLTPSRSTSPPSPTTRATTSS